MHPSSLNAWRKVGINGSNIKCLHIHFKHLHSLPQLTVNPFSCCISRPPHETCIAANRRRHMQASHSETEEHRGIRALKTAWRQRDRAPDAFTASLYRTGAFVWRINANIQLIRECSAVVVHLCDISWASPDQSDEVWSLCSVREKTKLIVQ